MTQSIDYGNLMHQAMRGLIRSVLDDVAENGLPGDHHFFITFTTTHPGVDIADWLKDRYPDEMTIVLQNWFDALNVTDDGFEVTLNFGNAPERLVVPFDALCTFVDPSVEFGLRFDSPEDAEVEPLTPLEDDPDTGITAEPEAPHSEAEPEKHDAEIVSLDQFRK